MPEIPFKFSYLKFGLSILIFIGLSTFALVHFDEAHKFLLLTRDASPNWLLLAVVVQVLTYISAGMLWWAIAKRDGYHLRLGDLFILSLEQLGIDQVIPSGGIAGNTLVYKTMRRFGLPTALAIKVNIVDILAFHISYSISTLLAVLVFWLHGGVPAIVSGLVSAYFVISGVITGLIVLLVFKKIKRLPNFVYKRRQVRAFMDEFSSISAGNILSPTLLSKATFLRALVFILDGLTLWLVMQAIGAPVLFTVAFTALVLGSIAGTVTFMPGGVGGFEVACVGALVLFGVEAEAAIAGTILLRGLTLWIPLVPGLILVHKEITRAA